MRTVARAVLVVAVGAGAIACDSLTGPHESGSCIAVVLLEGRYYVSMGTTEGATDFTPGTLYATVSRYRECQDNFAVDENGTIDNPPVPLGDGESNFLPVGTPLHRVDGYPPTERLAADTEYGWQLVGVQHEPDLFVADGVRVRLQLDVVDVVPAMTLTATLSYDNLNDSPVTVTSSAGCPAFVGVYRGETRIPFPETEYACTAALTSWTLPATETKSWEWSLAIGPDATPLEPGGYRFVAQLNTHDRVLERPFSVR
jgi:hypothetical protein